MCYKPNLLLLANHLCQVHQLSSEERKPWLKSAIFSHQVTPSLLPRVQPQGLYTPHILQHAWNTILSYGYESSTYTATKSVSVYLSENTKSSQDRSKSLFRDETFFFFFFKNNIYLVTTLLMTILSFTWRKIKTRYKRQRKNTMLQHLQLIKPKKSFTKLTTISKIAK